MPDEARIAGAFLLGLAAVLALTPLAQRLATRTGFYDHPVGYKAHAAATPYLGGAAVVCGFLVAALLFAYGASRFAAILTGAFGLCLLGTLDDRFTVRPRLRILGEVIAAAALWHFGLGWSLLDSRVADLALTVVWIVGFTNAVNLMDNMDGAASTVVSVCAVGLAAQALAGDDVGLAALAMAMAGACMGFLRYNLPAGTPARIFLGDGGSMPIGFVAAAIAMRVPVGHPVGWPVFLLAALLLAIPVLDTLLVMISRWRRGVPLATGGRDHLTHRLGVRLGSARAVAVALAVTQGCVSLLAVAAAQDGATAIIVLAVCSLAVGAAAIAVLERSGWPGLTAGTHKAPQRRREDGRLRTSA